MPIRFWLGLVYNFSENNCRCDFSSSSFNLRKGILPLLTKKYSNLEAPCCINSDIEILKRGGALCRQRLADKENFRFQMV